MKATIKQVRPHFGNAAVLETILQENGIWMLTVHFGRITEVVRVPPGEPAEAIVEQVLKAQAEEADAKEEETEKTKTTSKTTAKK